MHKKSLVKQVSIISFLFFVDIISICFFYQHYCFALRAAYHLHLFESYALSYLGLMLILLGLQSYIVSGFFGALFLHLIPLSLLIVWLKPMLYPHRALPYFFFLCSLCLEWYFFTPHLLQLADYGAYTIPIIFANLGIIIGISLIW